jgi:hypothetical protein
MCLIFCFEVKSTFPTYFLNTKYHHFGSRILFSARDASGISDVQVINISVIFVVLLNPTYA